MTKQLVLALAAGCALIGLGVANSQPPRPAAPAAGASTFAIRNVRVFDGERTIARTDVLVRDGLIAAVGGHMPAGVVEIDGSGRTLLPGLIDAHTHAFGDALERALGFGVTTELDMFTDHNFARTMRAAQSAPGGAPARADLFSAGTLVTAPKGHGTEYGMPIPTLSSAADAAAFVDARLAEESDYIKIVYDDGASYGMTIPTISRETMAATIAAARARGKLALVHTGSQGAAIEALDAGASGLIHLFADSAPEPTFAGKARRAGVFVTPTLSVIESTTGVGSGASLVEDAQVAPYLTAAERTALARSFPRRPQSRLRLEHGFEAVRVLREAGVPLLAGTDAPNPGTAHGASMHRELELLVSAGLSPVDALHAATAAPARAFALTDRGRIAPGLRADLLMVAGDPTANIRDTRNIEGIWKGGVRLERRRAPATTAAAVDTTGDVSAFEDGTAAAGFGSGWQVSTDSLMGGKSEAAMKVVDRGASGSKGALEISGTIAEGAPYPWAGAMFFPGATPMASVDLSRFKELVFWTRGDGGAHSLMVFADRLGNIPAVHPFTAGPGWQQVVVPFSQLQGIDGADVKGVLFSAGSKPGPFRFTIDDVRFR